LLQAPGPDWLLKRAGATRALNISCINPMRVSMEGSKLAANARTQEAWVEKRKAATAAAFTAAAAAVPASKKAAVAPLAEVKAALPAAATAAAIASPKQAAVATPAAVLPAAGSASTAALPAADIAAYLERDGALQKILKQQLQRLLQ
jgi:hypothetical protein